LINEIHLLEEEKKLLAMNVNEIKNQYKLAEDEHK